MTPSTAAAAAASPSPVASPSPADQAPAATGQAASFAIAAAHGSGISGSANLSPGTDGNTTVTVHVTGLRAGQHYIADADNFPCNPVQSFAVELKPDSHGAATATWTVPTGMDQAVTVQVLGGNGSFTIVAGGAQSQSLFGSMTC